MKKYILTLILLLLPLRLLSQVIGSNDCCSGLGLICFDFLNNPGGTCLGTITNNAICSSYVLDANCVVFTPTPTLTPTPTMTPTSVAQCGAASIESTDSGIIDVTDSASISLTGNFTLATWIKLNSIGGDVFNKEGAIFGNEYHLFTDPSDKLGFTVGTITNNPSVGLSTGIWVHVALTYDGSDIIQYLNGSQVSTYSSPSNFPTDGSGSLFLGVYHDGFFKQLRGLMDEPHIYSRALSSSEISVLASGSEPSTTNLEAQWTFNEGTGLITSDLSGNSNTGTLRSGAIWSSDVPIVFGCTLTPTLTPTITLTPTLTPTTPTKTPTSITPTMTPIEIACCGCIAETTPLPTNTPFTGCCTNGIDNCSAGPSITCNPPETPYPGSNFECLGILDGVICWNNLTPTPTPGSETDCCQGTNICESGPAVCFPPAIVVPNAICSEDETTCVTLGPTPTPIPPDCVPTQTPV